MSETLIFDYFTQVLGVNHFVPNDVVAASDPGPPWAVWIFEPEKSGEEGARLLEKILQALQFTKSDYRIISALDNLPRTTNLIFFGADPSSENFATYFSEYSSEHPSERISQKFLEADWQGTIVHVPGLDAMIRDPAFKKEAWSKLQPFKKSN